jgi:phosphate:Na+ symporter
VAAGFLLVVAGRWQAWRSLGWALSGLGLLFYGMHVMGLGVEPIRQHPAVAAQLAGLAEDPWLAFGAATLLTAVIQSSGATVALAMALTAQGALDVSAALPIVVGANVGTCATAVLAALGAGREGRRVAAVHLGFKLLAALLVMPFAGPLGRLMTDLLGGAGAGPERAVASVHTVFNVTLAVLFLPVCSRLAGLLGRLVPRGPGGTERIRSTLVSSLAGTPAVALMAAERVLSGMGQRCAAMLRLMLDAMEDDSGHKVERAVRADDEVDAIYSGLSGGLARLSQGGLSRDSAARQGRIMYAAKLFEEAGDLVSQDLGKLAERLERDGLSFSMGAMANLRRFGRAAADGLERAARAAAGEANPCAPDDGAVEREHRELLAAHFDQLARGVTDAGLTGSIYPDALAVLRDIRLVTVGIERALAEPSGDGGPAGRQEKGAG